MGRDRARQGKDGRHRGDLVAADQRGAAMAQQVDLQHAAAKRSISSCVQGAGSVIAAPVIAAPVIAGHVIVEDGVN